jgi:hypothetical protein
MNKSSEKRENKGKIRKAGKKKVSEEEEEKGGDEDETFLGNKKIEAKSGDIQDADNGSRAKKKKEGSSFRERGALERTSAATSSSLSSSSSSSSSSSPSLIASLRPCRSNPYYQPFNLDEIIEKGRRW